MNTDIYLDQNTHDIVVTEGSIRMTSSVEEDAAQRIKIRLLLFKGEWMLDTREGVPYYEEVFQKVSKVAVDAIFKAKILEEPLVDSISSFESTIDKNKRSYSLSFEVILKDSTTVSLDFTIGV